MKIINNTTGPLHWAIGYEGGGDCGDIPAGGTHEYGHLVPGSVFRATILDLSYPVDDDDSIVIISSRLETGVSRRAAPAAE